MYVDKKMIYAIYKLRTLYRLRICNASSQMPIAYICHAFSTIVFCLLINIALNTIVHVHTWKSVQYTDMHVTMVML